MQWVKDKMRVYSYNAWLLTLKQSIGPFLKEEVSPEQLEVREAVSLSLKDLIFDESALNILLAPTGLEVRSLKVRKVDLDLRAVTCKIDGINLILGLSSSVIIKEEEEENENENDFNQRTEGTSNRIKRKKKKQEQEQNKKMKEEEIKSNAVQALSEFINEVIDLINSYLDITISDLNIFIEFDQENNKMNNNMKTENKNDIHEKNVLSIHIPMFSFRDCAADRYNNETLQNVSINTEFNKLFTIESFVIKLNNIDVVETKDNISLNIHALLKKDSISNNQDLDKVKEKQIKENKQQELKSNIIFDKIKIECLFGNFDILLSNSQLTSFSNMISEINRLQSMNDNNTNKQINMTQSSLSSSNRVSNHVNREEDDGDDKEIDFQEFSDLSVDSQLSNLVSVFKPNASDKEKQKLSNLYKNSISNMIDGSISDDEGSHDNEKIIIKKKEDMKKQQQMNADEEDEEDEFFDCDDDGKQDDTKDQENRSIKHDTLLSDQSLLMSTSTSSSLSSSTSLGITSQMLMQVSINFMGRLKLTFINDDMIKEEVENKFEDKLSSQSLIFIISDPKVVFSNHFQDKVKLKFQHRHLNDEMNSTHSKKQKKMSNTQDLDLSASSYYYAPQPSESNPFNKSTHDDVDCSHDGLSNDNNIQLSETAGEVCVKFTSTEFEVQVSDHSVNNNQNITVCHIHSWKETHPEQYINHPTDHHHGNTDRNGHKSSMEFEEEEEGNLILSPDSDDDDDVFNPSDNESDDGLSSAIEVFFNPNMKKNEHQNSSNVNNMKDKQKKMAINIKFGSSILNLHPESWCILLDSINNVQTNLIFCDTPVEGDTQPPFILDITSNQLTVCLPLSHHLSVPTLSPTMTTSSPTSSTSSQSSLFLSTFSVPPSSPSSMPTSSPSPLSYDRRYKYPLSKSYNPKHNLNCFILQCNLVTISLSKFDPNSVSNIDSFMVDVAQSNTYLSYQTNNTTNTNNNNNNINESYMNDADDKSDMVPNVNEFVMLLMKTSQFKVASTPPSLSIQDRKDGLYNKTTPNMRIWEPSDDDGLLGRSMMLGQPSESSTETVWIEFSTVVLDVSADEFVVLMDMEKQISKLTCSSDPPASPSPSTPANSTTLSPTIIVACSSLEMSLISTKALPCLRCSVTDFITCSEPNSDENSDHYGSMNTCLSLHAASLAYFSSNGIWESILDHTPSIRSKPFLMYHDMFKMKNSTTNCKLNFMCLLLRYPREFEWVDEIIDLSTKIEKYNQNENKNQKDTNTQNEKDTHVTSQSQFQSQVKIEKKTLFIISEDMMIDFPGENKTSSQSPSESYETSQAVIDIIRTSFNTVLMTPKPPLQQFSCSMDHVRLLFAKESTPLSATTEHNFIQVVSIPGDRALSVRVSQEECLTGVTANISDVSISMCSDSLSALEGHFSNLNQPSLAVNEPVLEEMNKLVIFDEDNELELDRKISFDDSDEGLSLGSPLSLSNKNDKNDRKGLDVSFENGGFGHGSMEATMADFGLETLELLPCIEDYFNEEDDEEDDDDAFSGSYGSSSYTPSTFTQNGDLIQMNDKEGDYSATNILNKNSITSMKSKQSSLMKYLKIELLPWLKIGHEESFVWFERAASPPFEDPKAMFLLGQCYWRGEGVKTSAAKALDWWRKADVLGDSEAQVTLVDINRALSMIVANAASTQLTASMIRAWAKLCNRNLPNSGLSDKAKEAQNGRKRLAAFDWLGVSRKARGQPRHRGVGPKAKIVTEIRRDAFLSLLEMAYSATRNRTQNELIRVASIAQLGFTHIVLNGDNGLRRKEASSYFNKVMNRLFRYHLKRRFMARKELNKKIHNAMIKRKADRIAAKVAIAKAYYWFNEGHYLYNPAKTPLLLSASASPLSSRPSSKLGKKNKTILSESILSMAFSSDVTTNDDDDDDVEEEVPKDMSMVNNSLILEPENQELGDEEKKEQKKEEQEKEEQDKEEQEKEQKLINELYEEQCYLSGNIGIATKMRYVLRKQWNCQYQLKKWAHERMAIEALLFFKQTSLYADFGVVPDAVNGEAKKNRINAMVYLQHRVQLLKQNNGDHKQNINYMNSSQEKTFNHIEHQSASKHDLLVRIKIAYKRRGLLELVVKHTNQLNNIKSKLKVDDNQYIKNYKKYNKVLLKQNKLLKNKNNNNNNNNNNTKKLEIINHESFDTSPPVLLAKEENNTNNIPSEKKNNMNLMLEENNSKSNGGTMVNARDDDHTEEIQSAVDNDISPLLLPTVTNQMRPKPTKPQPPPPTEPPPENPTRPPPNQILIQNIPFAPSSSPTNNDTDNDYGDSPLVSHYSPSPSSPSSSFISNQHQNISPYSSIDSSNQQVLFDHLSKKGQGEEDEENRSIDTYTKKKGKTSSLFSKIASPTTNNHYRSFDNISSTTSNNILTHEELDEQEWYKIFHILDHNKDGFLDIEDLLFLKQEYYSLLQSGSSKKNNPNNQRKTNKGKGKLSQLNNDNKKYHQNVSLLSSSVVIDDDDDDNHHIDHHNNINNTMIDSDYGDENSVTSVLTPSNIILDDSSFIEMHRVHFTSFPVWVKQNLEIPSTTTAAATPTSNSDLKTHKKTLKNSNTSMTVPVSKNNENNNNENHITKIKNNEIKTPVSFLGNELRSRLLLLESHKTKAIKSIHRSYNTTNKRMGQELIHVENFLSDDCFSSDDDENDNNGDESDDYNGNIIINKDKDNAVENHLIEIKENDKENDDSEKRINIEDNQNDNINTDVIVTENEGKNIIDVIVKEIEDKNNTDVIVEEIEDTNNTDVIAIENEDNTDVIVKENEDENNTDVIVTENEDKNNIDVIATID